WRLRKGPLSGRLFGSIHIHHGPMHSLAIPYPAWRAAKCRSGHQIFLKERAQRLHRGLIKSSKKAGKRPSMRQLRSAKQSHEWFSKREESFIEGLEGWFSAHRVAQEHHNKI